MYSNFISVPYILTLSPYCKILPHANTKKKKKKKMQRDQSIGLYTNKATTVVIDPVYVQLFLWLTTCFISSEAFSFIATKFGGRNGTFLHQPVTLGT